MLRVLTIYGDSYRFCLGVHVNPPLFKGAQSHALAVVLDWFAYKVQGHSSTIGVGAS